MTMTLKPAKLDCPDCGAPMTLREKGNWGPWYACSKWYETGCRGAHGAHPDGTPLGIPATAETKQARIAAHAAFDTLWKSGRMKRKEAYGWLASALGMDRNEAHIAKLTKEQCVVVVTRIAELKK